MESTDTQKKYELQLRKENHTDPMSTPNLTKLALCLIVRGSQEEAEPLARCLSNVAPHVDGIFLTLTYPEGGGVNTSVEEVAKLYNANVTYFQWCHDFSKARNRNFAQVPPEYDYILWCDADDIFRGLDKLKATIEANPADTYATFYLYAFDDMNNPVVVHQKTQVVKNDGCVTWVGPLHEDFHPNREVTTIFIKDIERIHESSTTRFEAAKGRNLEVALAQLKELPNDPRSYWNVANAYKAAGKDEEALKHFDEFLKNSQSDDEKYIARLRRAECYWQLDRKADAIDEARYAIGTKPEYPDAFNLLGALYLETSQYKRASEMFFTALTRKPPYYSIIVYNPRDYDYVPMMNLAKCYVLMDRADLALPLLKGCSKIYPNDVGLKKTIRTLSRESKKLMEIFKLVAKLQKITDLTKLKAELDKVPEEYKSHPGICNIRNVNFVKTESSGKDLVFFCGFTEEEWTPDTAKKKGIGGSEEAVIWLSNLLADRGWNVTVYNKCGHKERTFDKVAYKPFWMWNYRDKQDVTVLWRSPKMAQYEINSSKIYLDLHDVIQPGELTEERLNRITKIFVKSKWQRNLFPKVPDDKFVIVPNGIDSSVFSADVSRNPKLLLNTSSPDRSIETLLDCYETVKEQVPDAELVWAYGWGVFDTVHGDNPKLMAWKNDQIRRMDELGVKNLGRVNHGKIAELYLQAQVFAYPSEFGEIDCISLSKAMAAGAVPVTTDFAAMGEKAHMPGVFLPSQKTHATWSQPYQFHFGITDPELKDRWVKEVVAILQHGVHEEQREEMRKWAREKYSWDNVANQWNNELCSSN